MLWVVKQYSNFVLNTFSLYFEVTSLHYFRIVLSGGDVTLIIRLFGVSGVGK